MYASAGFIGVEVVDLDQDTGLSSGSVTALVAGLVVLVVLVLIAVVLVAILM